MARIKQVAWKTRGGTAPPNTRLTAAGWRSSHEAGTIAGIFQRVKTSSENVAVPEEQEPVFYNNVRHQNNFESQS